MKIQGKLASNMIDGGKIKTLQTGWTAETIPRGRMILIGRKKEEAEAAEEQDLDPETGEVGAHLEEGKEAEVLPEGWKEAEDLPEGWMEITSILLQEDQTLPVGWKGISLPEETEQDSKDLGADLAPEDPLEDPTADTLTIPGSGMR